jgi:predicted small lipoprotein YifL
MKKALALLLILLTFTACGGPLDLSKDSAIARNVSQQTVIRMKAFNRMLKQMSVGVAENDIYRFFIVIKKEAVNDPIEKGLYKIRVEKPNGKEHFFIIKENKIYDPE